jgi:D-proline reductase (dithiol) PrdB
MAELSQLPFSTRLFLKAYPWRKIDPVPWTPLKKPLAQSRLALVSSAGFVLPTQARFDETIKGGDPSFREVPSDAAIATLVESHRSHAFNHSGIQQDPNLAFPMDRARELANCGRIGSLSRRHLSFMGSIIAPGRFVRDRVPQAASWLTEDGVDVALLVPV